MLISRFLSLIKFLPLHFTGGLKIPRRQDLTIDPFSTRRSKLSKEYVRYRILNTQWDHCHVSKYGRLSFSQSGYTRHYNETSRYFMSSYQYFMTILKYRHWDWREKLFNFQLMFFIWTFHHPYLLYFVHGTLAAAEPLEVDWSSRLQGTYQSKPSSAGSSDFCRPCAINYKCLRTNGAQQQTHATRVSRCWRGWSRDWTWPWWQMMRRQASRWE